MFLCLLRRKTGQLINYRSLWQTGGEGKSVDTAKLIKLIPSHYINILVKDSYN